MTLFILPSLSSISAYSAPSSISSISADHAQERSYITPLAQDAFKTADAAGADAAGAEADTLTITPELMRTALEESTLRECYSLHFSFQQNGAHGNVTKYISISRSTALRCLKMKSPIPLEITLNLSENTICYHRTHASTYTRRIYDNPTQIDEIYKKEKYRYVGRHIDMATKTILVTAFAWLALAIITTPLLGTILTGTCLLSAFALCTINSIWIPAIYSYRTQDGISMEGFKKSLVDFELNPLSQMMKEIWNGQIATDRQHT